MKTHPIWSVSLAAALLPLPVGTAPAAPLVLNNVSATGAAARLSAEYGISIVLKANTGRHLNVALEDTDAGTRLQTVNALANALRLDFTKTIVVSKGAGGAADPEAVDSGTSIPFGRTTLPTREAITLIAGVDAAFAKISGDVGGVVTLSRPTLTAAQAEDEVARQTGTTWKAVYVLAPRDLTASAASPLIFFPNRQREAEERREAEAAERQAAQEEAVPQSLPVGSQDMNGTRYYPNGYSSYGNPNQPYQNSPYGGSPYGSGGYASSGYPSAGYGFGNGGYSSGSAGGGFPNHVVGGGL